GGAGGLGPPGLGAVVAVLVAGLLNPVGIAAATLLALATASLAALAATHATPEPAATPRRARRSSNAIPAPAWLPAGSLSLAVLVWCVVDARSSFATKMAQGWNQRAGALAGAARDGALREAIGWTRRATELDPWSDIAWRDRAEAAHVGSLAVPSFEASMDDAERSAKRAIALAPLRAENHQSL